MKCSKQHLNEETFLLQCFTKRTDAFTCKFESYECCSATEIAPCLINCSNKINIFIGKIACTVRMFHHGDMLLLPQARRIAQHCDGTRRGNSKFLFHFAFRIGSCVFSFGAHISSWSGTRDTTLIRGLNHWLNRIIVKHSRPLFPTAWFQNETEFGTPNFTVK